MKLEQKNNLFSNINLLLKKKGIKKSDLETKAGFSTGYLSRFKNDDPDNLPSVAFLVSAADQLGVDMQTLLDTDLSHENYEEKFSIILLNKLIKDTKDRTIRWNSNNSEKKLSKLTKENPDSYFYPKTIEVSWLDIRDEFDEDNIRYPGEKEYEVSVECLGFTPADEHYVDFLEDYSEPFVEGIYSTAKISGDTLVALVPIGHYYSEDPNTNKPTVFRKLFILGEENDLLVDEEYASQKEIRLLNSLENAIEGSSCYISKKNRAILDSYLDGEKDHD